MTRQPADRHIEHAFPARLSELLEGAEDRKIAFRKDFFAPRPPGGQPRPLGRLLAGAVLAAQKAAGQWEIGQDAQHGLLTRWHELTLGAAVEQAVRGLVWG